MYDERERIGKTRNMLTEAFESQSSKLTDYCEKLEREQRLIPLKEMIDLFTTDKQLNKNSKVNVQNSASFTAIFNRKFEYY